MNSGYLSKRVILCIQNLWTTGRGSDLMLSDLGVDASEKLVDTPCLGETTLITMARRSWIVGTYVVPIRVNVVNNYKLRG